MKSDIISLLSEAVDYLERAARRTEEAGKILLKKSPIELRFTGSTVCSDAKDIRWIKNSLKKVIEIIEWEIN